MPLKLAFGNDPYNPSYAVQCIKDPSARADAHWLRQFVTAKVAQLRNLVIPARDCDRPLSKQEYDVVLVWFAVDANKCVSNHIKPSLLKHLTLQRVERRLAWLDATARRRPSVRRVIHAHAQDTPAVVNYCRKGTGAMA